MDDRWAYSSSHFYFRPWTTLAFRGSYHHLKRGRINATPFENPVDYFDATDECFEGIRVAIEAISMMIRINSFH